VLLTSLDAASDRYWGSKTGADGYLTKDFEAPDLTGAVAEVLAEAERARAGRPRIAPDPVDLTADDVLSKVCDLLDRKLFETSVAAEVTELAATTHGFDDTVRGLLDVVRRFVDFHLAGVLLLEEQRAYVGVGHEASRQHFDEYVARAAESVGSAAGVPFDMSSLAVNVVDPENLLDDPDEGPMATFLSMPLRGHGGRVVGVLALSSSLKNAFSETALSTLQLLEGPTAIVVDNARQSVSRAY
jgi:transcriptional regulator with GAF, ATPase, and Fis domain